MASPELNDLLFRLRDRSSARGTLRAIWDNGLAWSCHLDGRREYFPACGLDVALRTATVLLGVPVDYEETVLGQTLIARFGGVQ